MQGLAVAPCTPVQQRGERFPWRMQNFTALLLLLAALLPAPALPLEAQDRSPDEPRSDTALCSHLAVPSVVFGFIQNLIWANNLY